MFELAVVLSMTGLTGTKKSAVLFTLHKRCFYQILVTHIIIDSTLFGFGQLTMLTDYARINSLAM